MDKDLRIIAGAIVTESKLSKGAKKQLLNFIQKEATDTQVKALLLDGKIVAKIDDQEKEIIDARFENHKLNEGALKSILGMILLTPGGWAMWRGLKAAFSEKQRRCGVFSVGEKRDACLVAATVEFAKREIGMLQKATANCSQAKKPEKCKEQITKEITKRQAKIAKAQAKLRKKSIPAQAAGKEKAKEPGTKLL